MFTFNAIIPKTLQGFSYSRYVYKFCLDEVDWVRYVDEERRNTKNLGITELRRIRGQHFGQFWCEAREGEESSDENGNNAKKTPPADPAKTEGTSSFAASKKEGLQYMTDLTGITVGNRNYRSCSSPGN